jgi:hypothetical protein
MIGLAVMGPFTPGLTDVTAGFWDPGLYRFLFRSGGVVALLAALVVTERAIGRPATNRQARSVAWIGRRSLPVYVVHLMIVYGSPVTMGAGFWFDGLLHRTLDPLETAVAYGAITSGTLLLVAIWFRLGRRRPSLARKLAIAWWGGFALFFLLSSFF